MYVMQCFESTRFNVIPTDKPCYLKRFDPEFMGGLGRAWMTTNPREAMKFSSIEELFEFWKTRSVTRPTRPDGYPNRPLTAYSISPYLLEDA